MAIFESASTCGGTWSLNRLYPGLKSNNMAGTYEYPDFPMDEATYGVQKDEHIPGAVLNRYLTDFARHFGFHDQIRFNTSVDVVKAVGDAWELTVSDVKGKRTVKAARLILATGLTSTPNMPTYKGQEKLGVPLFHAKDFCEQASTLKNIKNATVIGAAKSAMDVAYAMVEDGATVDLVIRDNGNGPVWIAPRFVTPLKKRIDTVLVVRFMTWFTPCPFGKEDGYGRIQRFLHGTAVGRWMVNGFWGLLGGDVIDNNGYEKDPILKPLQPWNAAFWTGSGLSVLNYEKDIFDFVKQGKIKVHVGQIDHLEAKKVVLADGTELDTDVVVCSTGWKKESSIKFEGLGKNGFGLPLSEEELLKVKAKANNDILEMFPRLKDQPQLKFKQSTAEPLRLYRFMVPASHVFKRTLAFAGAVSSVNTASCATAQAHWIAAYMLDKLERAPATDEEVLEEIMLHTQWGRWRFPCGYGASLPDFAFDGLPYVNLLLNDLGLNVHRKKGWFAELTSPYMPRDFAGLVDEWKEKQNGDSKKTV